MDLRTDFNPSTPMAEPCPRSFCSRNTLQSPHHQLPVLHGNVPKSGWFVPSTFNFSGFKRSFHSRTRISWRKYWTKFKSIKILLKTREEKKPGRVSVVDSKQVTWRVTWITSMTSRLQNTNLHATYVITPLRLQSMGGIPMRLLRFDLCYRRFCGSSQGSCPQESFVSLSKVWFQSQEKGLLEKSHSTRVHDVKT